MKIELFSGPGETLVDRLTAAAQAEMLEQIVKDAKAEVREALRDTVEQTSRATGTAFTARHEGWTALLTDPQPRPRVADPVAFEGWWVEQKFGYEAVDRVVVADHLAARHLLAMIEEKSGNRLQLAEWAAEAFRDVTEYLLPEKPLELLTKNTARFLVNDNGIVDTDTGELVPGVTCTRGAPTLQVRGDKAAKARVRAELVERLGIPRELEAGAA